MKTAILLLITTSALTAADRWDRSRACSAQAEKIAGKLQAGTDETLRWAKGMRLAQSHYSPKYQRCFAYLEWSGSAISVTPFKELLIDPFEGRWLASLDADRQRTDGTSFWMCRDDAGRSYSGMSAKDEALPKDCSDVQSYIDERLKN